MIRLTGPAPATPDEAASKSYVDTAVAAAPTKTYVDTSIATATAIRAEQVVVDFGDDDTTASASALASWVLAGDTIICVPDPAGTTDHSAEDAAVENVLCTAVYVEPGIGFDVLALAPGGTFGRYAFTCYAV